MVPVKHGKYEKIWLKSFVCNVQHYSFCHAKMDGWPAGHLTGQPDDHVSLHRSI